MVLLPQISPVSDALDSALRHKIDRKTKPQGALGKLETLAFTLGRIQARLHPTLDSPHIIVFAADHGVAQEGISAYPQIVTTQMVYNFLSGGAAINVFCRLYDLELWVVDAGVMSVLPEHERLIQAKMGWGTRNMRQEPAMTQEACEAALLKGLEIAIGLAEKGCNLLGLGEMGIGNTTAAAAISCAVTGLQPEEIVGAGTGLSQDGIEHKIQVVKDILRLHNTSKDPFTILQCMGGYEIAMMCGAMIGAASRNMAVLVDGFIASSAYLIARLLSKNMDDYAIFTHVSAEKGHAAVLHYLRAEPLLQLGLRLGEGTGCALAYPLLQAATAFLNEMSSFEEAGVSDKSEN